MIQPKLAVIWVFCLESKRKRAFSYRMMRKPFRMAELVSRVALTIRQHLRPPEDAPLESGCLYDADTIDANIGLPAFVRLIRRPGVLPRERSC